jgi:hypothetical protein
VLTLSLHEFELPLRHAFTIARGTVTVQPTLIVELSNGVHRGYGEATTNSYYGESRRSWRAIRSRSARSTKPRTTCGASSTGRPFTSCGACRRRRRRRRTSRSGSTHST